MEILCRFSLSLVIAVLWKFRFFSSEWRRIIPGKGEGGGSSGCVVHFGAESVGVGEVIGVGVGHDYRT